MKFEIITLFPDYFSQSLKQSLIGKAVEKQLFEIEIVNLRDFATDKHNTVDDTPFGGGGGMVLMLGPLDKCLQSLGYEHLSDDKPQIEKNRIILTSAAGRSFGQSQAIRYSLLDKVTIICGHYLGVDERLLELYEIDEVSIGDYVLSGGEPAAAVMVDAVARLIPGVLGNFESAIEDSHMETGLGCPVYTRPAEYEGLKVPEQLTGGNHREIEKYRRESALMKSATNRPDLLENCDLSENDKQLVKNLNEKKSRD